MSPSGAALPWLARALRSEAFPGALLVAAAATALMIANSSWSAAWSHLWDAELAVEVGPYALQKPVQHWINDGLMVLFFFFVGLELKHEVLDGGLQSAREASLPIAAAVGGMLAPAALYALVLAAHGDGEAVAGWGIPMATDIAFALGVLALLGSRAPKGLRVFLATLAIVDDLGAVLVIAVFYTDDVHWQLFGAGLALLGLSYALNRLGVRRTWPFVVIGLVLWLTFLRSGVHATLAGTLLALTVPARRRLEETVFADRARALVDEFQLVGDANTPMTNQYQLRVVAELERHCENVQAPLQRMKRGLEPLVAHLILPLFALANAGVDLRHGLGEVLSHPAARGVLVGLVIGKPLGVLAASALAMRLFGATFPDGATWRHLAGAAFLAGIGFTMSLFIDGLAFASATQPFRAAKAAVLAASGVSAAIGFALLFGAARGAARDPPG